MNVFAISILLCVNFVTVIWAHLYHPRFVQFTRNEVFAELPTVSDDPGDPLLLTPLIDAGQYVAARSLAEVQPSLGGVVSYSGFLTVNRTTNSHLFFWFIPKVVVDLVPTPLMLWLQGGPGCSSLFGLFNENGPFNVTKDGLQSREHAWTNHYHMLYIDQPIGTGFSFTEDQTNGYVNDQEGVREHLYEALIQFYKVFPEMRYEDFYVAGESYAGKYVPALGHRIHTANRQPSAFEIPLKGMMIGNGFSDPINIVSRSKYLKGLDMIDESDRVKLEMGEKTVMFLIQSGKYLEALESHLVSRLDVDILNHVNDYDYTQEETVIDSSYELFLTQDHIRKSIHVGRSKYETCSSDVYRLFEMDFMQTVRPWIEELLEHYPILFYNGQFDLTCPHLNSEEFLSTLRWSGANEYGTAKRQLWVVDDSVAGYHKVGSNLFDVWVRGAGHMVPSGQSKNALRLIKSFVEKRLLENKV